MINEEEYVIEWDIKTWKKAFTYWEKNIQWDKISHALEIGSRNGGPTWWIANKGIIIDCTDRLEVQKNAFVEHLKRGGNKNISYFDLDVLELEEIEKYDLVICKSVLGGVGHRGKTERIEDAINRIYRSLKPGGVFLFAENLVSSPIHVLLRRTMTKWGNAWNYLTEEQIHQMTSQFESKEIQTTGFIAAFGRNEKQRNTLAKIDQILLPIIPKKWNYLGYGIATKKHEQ